MGLLLAKIWSNPPPKEQLEKITKELDEIHDNRLYTQLRHKQVVGFFLVISVILYFITAPIFFIWYFPSELIWRIVYSIPFIVFPAIIWVIKLGVHHYFKYSLSQNENKVTILLRQRKKLLDEVKEKETYKVAKEILEKYDPDQLSSKSILYQMAPMTGSLENLNKAPEMEMRRRSSFGAKRLPSQQPKPGTTTQVVRPSAIIKPGYNAPPGTIPKTNNSPQLSVRPVHFSTPCPILPRQRGGFDRLVEYVLSDGPSNRYALICRQCQSHNGMALQEEFEYISYKCCYCFYYNPARKNKPAPPRLFLPGPKAIDQTPIKEPNLDESQVNLIDNKGSPDGEVSEEKNHEEMETMVSNEVSASTSEESREVESATEIANEEENVEDQLLPTADSTVEAEDENPPESIPFEDEQLASNDNLDICEESKANFEISPEQSFATQS